MARLSTAQQELLDAMQRGVRVLLMKGFDPYYFRGDSHKKCTASVRVLLSRGLVEKFAEDWRMAHVRPLQISQTQPRRAAL